MMWHDGKSMKAKVGSAIGFTTAVCAIAFSVNCAQGQITPDSTLPNNSTVTLQGNTHVIEGGTRTGGNLFHSFREFSVPTDGTALFNNALDIQNIISRVTGGSVSNINGLIRTNGAANLFLINPTGIIFGENASLNIGGSFLASTASSIKFADGFEFSTKAPKETSLLTVSVPIGLQFGSNPAGILNQSQATNSSGEIVGLQVQPGKTLALVGGNVNLNGGLLQAPGGRVELGGLSETGTIGINTDSNNLSLSFPDGVMRSNVSLTNGASILITTLPTQSSDGIIVNASQLDMENNSAITTLSQNSSKDAGDITIQATDSVKLTDESSIGSISLDTAVPSAKSGSIILETGKLMIQEQSQIATLTSGQRRAGNLTIYAPDSVELTGASLDGSVSSGLFAQTLGSGDAGVVSVTTGKLIVQDGARISAATIGEGRGGDLLINSDIVELSGTSANEKQSSDLSSNATSSGAAGDVKINTQQLTAKNGASVSASTTGSGQGGVLEINASDMIQLIGRSTNGTQASGVFADTIIGSGNAGDLKITTGRLLVQEGAFVSVSTLGQGQAGNLEVKAYSVELIGTFDGKNPSGLYAEGDIGAGGNIKINTNQLIARNGARVRTNAFGAGKGGRIDVNASLIELTGTAASGYTSGLFTSSEEGATGNAGDLNIVTERLLVQGGGEVSSGTFGKAQGGNLDVSASDSIELIGTTPDSQRSSGLFTGTTNTGASGNLKIETRQLFVKDGATVLASTFGAGQGGNININASDSIELIGFALDGFPSGLLTETRGTGTAGNLKITTEQLTVKDRANVSVSSQRTGKAGNLEILSGLVNLDNQGKLIAENTSGNGGNITLQSRELLLLRRGSQISTTAGTVQAGGDGGNITINSPFIVAVPKENSDINANAFTGKGGRVDITAYGIFGIQSRNSPTSLSDITASSERGVAGTVEINTPDIDPNRGLVELPANLVDASQQIANSCTPGSRQSQSSFIATGRGGLPISPNQPLQDTSMLSNWVRVAQKPATTSNQVQVTPSLAKSARQIVEAQNWVVDGNGNVMLVAQAPQANPRNSWQASVSCPAF
ncbi:two-partner secretion domain-containing protein [Calothrix sp. NIES-2098]|uniref:two-partner secretion domain-containing protein n=1 Tax=Calothrix sp. NIES-2098 TaxID=1954171 RepID=UPI000B60C013|nr:filamentous hemagglutinin outer membrane protein [Calothrix sp. NIES-2098]